jgi:hypothetical protein
MTLSIHALKSSGFEEIPNGKELEATFSLVKAYQVEGITLQECEFASLIDLCHKSEEFSFGFGNRLNDICQYLLNEDFDDDEEKWMVENKARPPFLIIIVHLNKFFIGESGYWKKEKIQDKEFILTHESFPEAKKLLKIKGEKIVPQIISSLSVYFSLLHQPVRFRSILTETYGNTKLGERIYDFQMVFSIKGYSSVNVNPADVKTVIHNSINLHSQLDSRVSSFLHLALEEDDMLKKFLYFFLVLEIYTHQTFKKIDFRNYVNNINQIPDRIKISGELFFLERQAESKTLSQRFHWCAILIWVGIDDNDIENFKSIKKIRDKIAHGENICEPMLPIDTIERLCLKVLSSHQTS